MPRPNKPINSASRLSDPVSNSRGSTWSKHAGPEHSDQYEPDGKILVDPLTHATVAHVDLTEDEPTVDLDPTPAVEIVEPVPMFTYRWTSERTIEGRTYRRTDRKVAEPVS